VALEQQSPAYEAFALKYASIQTAKASKYHRYEKYGEPDEQVGLDFFFWLVRNGERTVLVDCGYDDVRTAARGYFQDRHPLELLSSIDVTPGDIDHVVLSHLHFDHIGNVDLFPDATFSVARSELEYWTGPYADRPLINESGDPDEIQLVADLLRDDRLHLVDGVEEILPGIEVRPIRGHTPGQLITEVATRSGSVVLASDTIHFYEEMELDRPYWVFHDLEGMYHGYDALRTLGARPGASIVAGHDPRVMEMFEPVCADVVDLASLRGTSNYGT